LLTAGSALAGSGLAGGAGFYQLLILISSTQDDLATSITRAAQAVVNKHLMDFSGQVDLPFHKPGMTQQFMELWRKQWVAVTIASVSATILTCSLSILIQQHQHSLSTSTNGTQLIAWLILWVSTGFALTS
jgi:hypothetical protein